MKFKKTIYRETAIARTARVMQLEGIFDIPPSQKSSESWDVSIELPDKWNIGLIVGPSGSGKSTLLQELFPRFDSIPITWEHGKSVVDSFPPEMPIKEIVNLLSSVGFSSPPNWLRPVSVLSNGEKFRVNMARLLAEPMPEHGAKTCDEFTSVVDRKVAKIGSAAIAKTARKMNQKLVLASCHYDIVEWLNPDWIYEPHIGKLTLPRGSLQRPKINITIQRVGKEAWKIFHHHHYLSGELNNSAACFCGFVENDPVAFCAWLPFVGKLSHGLAYRGHRTVVLPDYQGVGIGTAMLKTLASMFAGLGYRVFADNGHPGQIARRRGDPDWNMTRQPGFVARDGRTGTKIVTHSGLRWTASFEFIGRAMPKHTAKKLFEI